jgi:SPP1 gp7 family putative phage head morphogenesis protein
MTRRFRAQRPRSVQKALNVQLPPLGPEERQLADAFLEAVGRLQMSAGGPEVLSELLGENWQQAIEALDWDGWREVLARAQSGLEAVIQRAGTIQFATVAGLEGVGNVGHLVNFASERAVQLAADFSGSMITGLTDSTRAAVRDIIAEAVGKGYSVPRTADLLKETIGLSPRYAGAVDRLQRGLLEKVAANEMSEGQVREAVSAYADRLLANRAETVARYEVQDAVNAGRIDSWRQAALRGSIGPDATKTWVTGEDERVCPDCNDLDGTDADGGIEGTWSGPDGDVTMPPLHPNCRCTAVISDPGNPEAQAEEPSTDEGE